MTTNIFEAKVITSTVEVPVELCDISKQTKNKYLKYFKNVGNTGMRSESQITQRTACLRSLQT